MNINTDITDIMDIYSKTEVSNRFGFVMAFEGIDGSGKSLQADMLAESLKSKGYNVGVMSFPVYSSFFGFELGKMLSGSEARRADNVDAKSMALWYAMDRWRAFQNYKSQEFDFLLLNRFTLSNAVYQSIRVEEDERDELIDWIFDLEHVELGLPVPDVYFVFDLGIENSRDNILKKGQREYLSEKFDVYEKSANMLSDARKQYLKIAKKMKNIELIDCLNDSGQMRIPEEIKNSILGILDTHGAFK